jgi:hypothetical protein
MVAMELLSVKQRGAAYFMQMNQLLGRVKVILILV